ncbi:MAG: tail fiber protein [Deltaproteobacteria bacterium]|nr:tail fiber protein [Deltaproteobacteria bacterium]
MAPGGAAATAQLVQSIDGVTDDYVTTLAIDTTQAPQVVYTATIDLVAPFLKIVFVNSGAPTTLAYSIVARPSASGGGGSGGGGGGGSVVPTGTVLDFAGASAPSGYLLADGTVYPIATYPALGALLGATYGGDGITTFGVPDGRGRSTVGVGTGPGLTPRALGATGGEENHALVTGELAAHGHPVTDPGHSHAYSLGNEAGASSGLDNDLLLLPGTFSGAISAASTGITVGSTGSGTGHNTMHPFVALNKIIKT